MVEQKPQQQHQEKSQEHAPTVPLLRFNQRISQEQEQTTSDSSKSATTNSSGIVVGKPIASSFYVSTATTSPIGKGSLWGKRTSRSFSSSEIQKLASSDSSSNLNSSENSSLIQHPPHIELGSIPHALSAIATPTTPTTSAKTKENLIIVSNRLPVTIEGYDAETKEWKMKKSSGGLVTALLGLKATYTNFKWIGWLGQEIKCDDPEALKQLEKELFDTYSCIPVYLPAQEADLFYNGFSNGILWPNFHYQQTSLFNQKMWEAYHSVNQKFADVVIQNFTQGDLVWVHDYHLLLLPKMLRAQRREIYISFFLHIPFPSSEVYRQLPVRKELLEGLAASNLIGFHTFDFVRHFLTTIDRTFGYEVEVTPEGFYYNGLFCKTLVSPIGIDPTQFINEARKQATKDRAAYFAERYKDKKIILGIDRLDYTKGIDLKILTYEKMLELHPELQDQVVLIQVGVPTRESVEQYQKLISKVNRLVGRVNSKFSTLETVSIHYIHKSVNLTDLCALYAIADVMAVFSVRDGMNLVSAEFVAVNEEACNSKLKSEPGVLVLSEFAGAAKSLGGALIINPYNIEESAELFYKALTMDEESKKERQRNNFGFVSRNNVNYWATSFLRAFKESIFSDVYKFNDLGSPLTNSIVKRQYTIAKHRLLIFDLDGPRFYNHSTEGANLGPVLSSKIVELIQKLSLDPKNIIYVISTKDRREISKDFPSNIGIIAELGLACRFPDRKEWISIYSQQAKQNNTMVQESSNQNFAKDSLSVILTQFEKYFTAKHSSNLVYEYSNKTQDPINREWQTQELMHHLRQTFGNKAIAKGSNNFHIHPSTISKDMALEIILNRSILGEEDGKKADFLFICGDTTTDDSLFSLCTRYVNAILDNFAKYSDFETEPQVRGDRRSYYPGVVSCLIGEQKASSAQFLVPDISGLTKCFDEFYQRINVA